MNLLEVDHYLICPKTVSSKSLYSQELVDCYYKDSSWRNGCGGGTQRNGFLYAKYKKRLATYNNYRYTGVGECAHFLVFMRPYSRCDCETEIIVAVNMFKCVSQHYDM